MRVVAVLVVLVVLVVSGALVSLVWLACPDGEALTSCRLPGESPTVCWGQRQWGPNGGSRYLASVPESLCGAEIGRGMRSTVYEWGPDSVIKVPLADTPDAWADFEFRYASAVVGSGVRVPAQGGVVVHNGRRCTVAERIVAPSMIDALIDEPGRGEEFGRLLAEIQISLCSVVPSIELPRQIDRLSVRIRAAAHRYGAVFDDALDVLAAAEAPTLVLCHGDLHPRNVLLAAEGPVLIDWFDACRGLPIAEAARSVLLLEQLGSAALSPSLGRVDREAFLVVSAVYRESIVKALDLDEDALRTWIVVQRIARMAEGLELDPLATIDRDALRLS